MVKNSLGGRTGNSIHENREYSSSNREFDLGYQEIRQAQWAIQAHLGTGPFVKFLTDGHVAFRRSSRQAAYWLRLPKGEALIIKSPAGEFPITIDRFEIENAELVIVGRMGVWDARTHIDAADFLRLFAKLFLSPAVLFYALKAPFLLLRRKSGGSA